MSATPGWLSPFEEGMAKRGTTIEQEEEAVDMIVSYQRLHDQTFTFIFPVTATNILLRFSYDEETTDVPLNLPAAP